MERMEAAMRDGAGTVKRPDDFKWVSTPDLEWHRRWPIEDDMSLRTASLAALLPLSVLIGAAAPPPAAVALGKRLVTQGNAHGILPCAACHGSHLQGNRATGAARIAGVAPAETVSDLAHIAEMPSGNYVMRHIARSMTPTEAKAIAAYLATIKP